ncbi:NAD-dependent epimerase/dehydratase family protein [Gramella sp. BOM4]|nr:NAD-dependent epimerase/dehydratase family protein [Christiangramia bathymodioli]
MQEIDKTRPVMVTGATGYVAGWLVKKLLEKGMTVHAAVRDPEKEHKVHHLNGIAANGPGKIKYFKADLLHEGSYAEAMEGCEVVFHTASPFTSDFKDPEKELIEPAVKGTANVLLQANECLSVKRIVLTSSCAAIYTDAIEVQKIPDGSFTENIWNTSASIDYQPYSYSKTLAEKKAWEINKNQNRWDLVVINPSLVMGPPLNPQATTSESFSLLKQMGDGTFKMGTPKVGIGLVDVRDVAEAHIKAAFTPSASGRYITSAHNTNFVELGQALAPKYGKSYPVPTKALPKWLLLLIGPLLNKSLSRRFIKNNVDVEWRADNSKIKRDLKMNFRPLRETMEDSFQVLIENDVI